MNARAVWTWMPAGLIGTLATAPAYAQSSGAPSNFWHAGWGWGWGHMMFGSLMMLLFWGAMVLAVVLAVRWLSGPGDRAESSSTRALAILEERFARGEIDREEFEERKRLLSN